MTKIEAVATIGGSLAFAILVLIFLGQWAWRWLVGLRVYAGRLIVRRQVREFGTITNTFGKVLWWRRRKRRGRLETVSLLFTWDDFEDLLKRRKKLIPLMRFGMVTEGDRLGELEKLEAYADVARLISADFEAGADWILRRKEIKVRAGDRADDWRAALVWFGCHHSTFNFHQLDFPKPGLALVDTLGGAQVRGCYIADDDVMFIEGGGGEWTISLSGGRNIQLREDQGIVMPEGA